MPRPFTPIQSRPEKVNLHCQIDLADREAIERFATENGISLAATIAQAIRLLTRTEKERE